jgi:DNA-binding NarL/FixJ family response regulator
VEGLTVLPIAATRSTHLRVVYPTLGVECDTAGSSTASGRSSRERAEISTPYVRDITYTQWRFAAQWPSASSIMMASMSARIEVVLADDHALVRRGTREILEEDPGIRVTGEASNGEEAVALVERLRPHVALFDVSMPTMNGVEAARRVRSSVPTTGVIMLTVHDDDEYVWEAVKAGASGYLVKDVGAPELIRAVRAVAAGGAVLDPALTTHVIERLRAANKGLEQPPLITDREREVMQLVARGKSNREIAETLGLSTRTVEAHLNHVYKKLGVGSRTEAAIQAFRSGLVTLDPAP